MIPSRTCYPKKTKSYMTIMNRLFHWYVAWHPIWKYMSCKNNLTVREVHVWVRDVPEFWWPAYADQFWAALHAHLKSRSLCCFSDCISGEPAVLCWAAGTRSVLKCNCTKMWCWAESVRKIHNPQQKAGDRLASIRSFSYLPHSIATNVTGTISKVVFIWVISFR